MVSQYHFRGIQQTAGASTSAGLDFSNGGFYVGTWAADVDAGLEIDFYAGYGIELESGISLGAGVTTYQYTGEFDSAYNGFKLNAGFGLISLENTIGRWDGVGSDDAEEFVPESDYTFFGLTIEHNCFSGTFGSFGDEVEGEYLN
jgi:uncharacterized protein (TIGR02001 family)